jgi:hypothetical protein
MYKNSDLGSEAFELARFKILKQKYAFVSPKNK